MGLPERGSQRDRSPEAGPTEDPLSVETGAGRTVHPATDAALVAVPARAGVRGSRGCDCHSRLGGSLLLASLAARSTERGSMDRTPRPERAKGRFSVAGLKVAKAYVFPRRWRLVQVGSVAAAAVVLFLAVDRLFFHSRFISGGPLSSAHASFENDCARCHRRGKTVADDKCSVCHEKTGDELGVFTFAAHAVYRSGDPSRAVGERASRGHLFTCADCHSEHRGRDAQITRMSDRQCVGCHDYGSF